MNNEKEFIEYRGEKIEIFGRGYLYGGLLWPNLAGLHNAIDNSLDGTQKTIFVPDYFPHLHPIKVNYYPPFDTPPSNEIK